MRSSPPLRRWRTIRQRARRAQAGQVSAVATVLGLLLLTTFIANFVLIQLPNQMQQNEFNHELEVQNQLSVLQATVLALATQSHVPTTALLPVQLGSRAAPPFGPASTSEITPEGSGGQTTASYKLANVVQSPPDWNASPTCPPTGQPCNQGTMWDNITGVPNNTYNLKINGGQPTLVLNFSGSYDTININWLGKSVNVVYMIFNGSFLHVTFNKGSSGGSGNSPQVVAFFYGQHDVLEVGFNGFNIAMTTRFFGYGATCPNGNLSNTDHFYWNSTSNSNTTVSVTWYNSVGYTSGPTTIVFPGSTLTFQNKTGFSLGCAWDIPYPAQYSSPFISGLKVHLDNRYASPADLVYDEGAVILSHPGLGSVMVSPPVEKFTRNGAVGGWNGNLTFVNILANFTAEQGTQTAGVAVRVVSVHQFLVESFPKHRTFLGGLWLNLTTPYPYAWNSFFQTFPAGTVLGSVSCIPPPGFPPGGNCLVPPAGTAVTLSVPVNVVQFILTIITVQLTIS